MFPEGNCNHGEGAEGNAGGVCFVCGVCAVLENDCVRLYDFVFAEWVQMCGVSEFMGW